jgi:hypothetical protein
VGLCPYCHFRPAIPALPLLFPKGFCPYCMDEFLKTAPQPIRNSLCKVNESALKEYKEDLLICANSINLNSIECLFKEWKALLIIPPNIPPIHLEYISSTNSGYLTRNAIATDTLCPSPGQQFVTEYSRQFQLLLKQSLSRFN